MKQAILVWSFRQNIILGSFLQKSSFSTHGGAAVPPSRYCTDVSFEYIIRHNKLALALHFNLLGTFWLFFCPAYKIVVSVSNKAGTGAIAVVCLASSSSIQ